MQKPQFLLQLLLLACHCLGLRHWGQISRARSFQLKCFQTVYQSFFSYYNVWDVMSFSCLVLVCFFMEFPKANWVYLCFVPWIHVGGFLMRSSLQCNNKPKNKLLFLCQLYIHLIFSNIFYHELIFMNSNQIRVFLIVQKFLLRPKQTITRTSRYDYKQNYKADSHQL